jgi:hypothetical protein
MGGSGDGEISFSSAAPAGTHMMFQVDSSITRIEYRDAMEIVEVHRSLNFARITPDGKFPENSSAFICVIDRNGGKRVYVPFLLTSSGKILVYVPERQPENAEELTAVIGDAVFFTETVGFVMEDLTLPKAGESRNAMIRAIPVLTRVD